MNETSTHQGRRRSQVSEVLSALWQLSRPLPSNLRPPTNRGIRYGPPDQQRGIPPLVDIYLPDGLKGPHPSVVIVHGGGFVIGSRTMRPVRLLTERFLQAGYAVAAVDYRLIFRGGGLTEAVEDVSNALDWWMQQIDEYNLDPSRIHVMSMSAGAAIALLALSTREKTLSGRIVCAYGIYDFSTLRGRWSSLLRRKLTGTFARDIWQALSPVTRHPTTMPLLLIHGTEDGLSPVEQAYAMKDARDSSAEDTRLVVYEDAFHAFLSNDKSPFFEPAIQEILRFFGE